MPGTPVTGSPAEGLVKSVPGERAGDLDGAAAGNFPTLPGRLLPGSRVPTPSLGSSLNARSAGGSREGRLIRFPRPPLADSREKALERFGGGGRDWIFFPLWTGPKEHPRRPQGPANYALFCSAGRVSPEKTWEVQSLPGNPGCMTAGQRGDVAALALAGQVRSGPHLRLQGSETSPAATSPHRWGRERRTSSASRRRYPVGGTSRFFRFICM